MALVRVLALLALGARLHAALRSPAAAVVAVATMVLLVLGELLWTVRWWWHVQRLGPLELRAGRSGGERARALLASGAAGFATLAALVAVRDGGLAQPQAVGQTCAACGWLGMVLLTVGTLRVGVQLRRDGMASFGWACRWDRIVGYDWTGEDSATLVLYLRRARLRGWHRRQRLLLEKDDTGRVDARLRARLGPPRLERVPAPPPRTGGRWTGC
jgi:hypothetical protein